MTIGAAAVANVSIAFPVAGNANQNGPDGVNLVDGAGGIIDSIAYGGDVPGAGEGQLTLVDDVIDGSICRLPDGWGTDDNTSDFALCTSIPGATNF